MSTTTTTTTTTTDRVPRGDVTATLSYFLPPTDSSAIPFNYTDTPPEGEPQNNFGEDLVPTTIHDIRGRESEFTLDRDAFQVIQNVPISSETSFSDDDSIKKNYYPEVEKLLLESIPGSNRIHIFDHTIRRADPDAPRKAVNRVHIDQVAASSKKRVQRYYEGEEAEALLKGRYRIVNVWRPLNKTAVESQPLAFASSITVEDADVVPVEHRYPDGYLGHTAGIKHNPGQKWHYLSGMTGNERLLLECFDSESLKPGSGIGGRVPHTAFVDPRTREDAVGRESIEVRALVFGP